MKNYLWHSLALNLIFYAVIVGATGLVLFVTTELMPAQATGSLIYLNGHPVGSRLIAQRFSRPGYLWPRPSAINYDAAAAGGSNLSPTSPTLRQQVIERLASYKERPVPAELVTASGSGLDPHLSWKAARFQWNRISSDRGLGEITFLQFVEAHPEVTDEYGLINVLMFNIALFKSYGSPESK